MYSLSLHGLIISGSPPQKIDSLTEFARGWRRSTRAHGGYWLGSFTLSQEDLTSNELQRWFERYIAHHVQEKMGIKSWEGLIVEMTLTQDGIKYRRTLDREWWHNYVKVAYRDEGVKSETAWGQDADSVGEYGRMEYIDTIGEATSAEATGLRDTRLEDFAFPRSRMVGGLEFGSEPRERRVDTLEVTVAGYVATLNWRFRETSIAATAASTAISTLVGASEFVTAGAIDTNSLSVDVNCSTPQRLWDAIAGILDDGDASGNRWVGGVYDGRVFNYNAAATTVEYRIRNGILTDRGGSQVIPALLKPDFIVRNAAAPSGMTPLGGNVWDDPRNAWITEVEFVAPDGLVLKPSGFEDVQILKEQLK